MMSKTGRRGSSAAIGSWNTTWMSLRNCLRSARFRPPVRLPKTVIVPCAGSARLRISSSVVVLPQPDSPTRPRVSPERMSKEMPSTARTVPTRRLKTAPTVSGKCRCTSVSSSTDGRCARSSRAEGASGISGTGKTSAAVSVPAASSLRRWHADGCSSPTAGISSGSTVAHIGTCTGQRARKGQPAGRLTSDGGLPSIGTRACLPPSSMRGIEPSKPIV